MTRSGGVSPLAERSWTVMAGGKNLPDPGSFIEYSRVPKDEKTKHEAWTLMGLLTVNLNRDLADNVFVLSNPKPKPKR